ncbi:Transporter of the ATP-binding cassette (ABC) [Batrachochytrium dendrobatidis]
MLLLDLLRLEWIPLVAAGLVLLVVLILALSVAIKDYRSRVGYVQLLDNPTPSSSIVTNARLDPTDSVSSNLGESADGSIRTTWQDIDHLTIASLPATALEQTIMAASVLLSILLGTSVTVFIFSSMDYPLQLLQDTIWFAVSLCLVYLHRSSKHPASDAPRSVALFYLAFSLTRLFSVIQMFILEHPIDLIFWIHVTILTLGWVCCILDVSNPPRNAARLKSVRVQKRSISGQETASFMSLISFSWVVPLLNLGRSKPLESEDIPHLAKYDQMDQVVERWKKLDKSNNVFWDLLRMTHKYAAFQIFVSFITATLSFSNPFFINRLLNWIQNRQPEEGWVWGVVLLVGMFTFSILNDILNSQINLSGRHWGIQLRSVLMHEIFSKSTRRAGRSGAIKSEEGEDDDNSASQGKIVSLMSTDTRQIRNFITDIHSLLIDTPWSIIMSISGLLFLMGPPALAGLFVLVISGPISGWTLALRYKILKQTRTLQDRRIQATNEALLGIRIIKYMAWEIQFLKKIIEARDKELTSRFKLLLNNLIMVVISWGSSILVTFVSFFFYTVVAGKTLDAATAFTSISLLTTVSFTLSSLSEDVSRILNVQVIMARIQSFLNEEELERYQIADSTANMPISACDRSENIGFSNAEFGYYTSSTDISSGSTGSKKPASSATDLSSTDASSALTNVEESHTFYLRNLSIQFQIGKLTTIIGPTGSGKTSLLCALLGEMKRYNGDLFIPHQTPAAIAQGISQSNIAYVAQTAWLLNATIRDNILFGEPYDEERYNQVITACSLRRDLATFQGGDLTEIGEKGVNLSGGQKQRVSLARAAYSRAQIVLLDDPLSAVDAPTARQLFYQCILTLLKGRTVLLVTHAIGLTVLQSDHVIVMKNGEVFGQGTPQQMIANPEIDAIIVSEMNSTMSAYKSDDDECVEAEEDNQSIKPGRKNGKRLTDQEGKATGSVKFATYLAYITACGGFLFLFFVLLGFLLQTSADFLSNWWIQRWTDNIRAPVSNITLMSASSRGVRAFDGAWAFEGDSSVQINSVSDSSHVVTLISNAFSTSMAGDVGSTSQATNDALFYISIYGLISIAELFSLIFKYVVQFMGGIRASRVMHSRLIESVLGSPMRFFETTPVGRIINRFSNDLSDVDMGVMYSVLQFFTLTFGSIVRVGLVTFVTPPFLFSIVFLYFYYYLAQYYLLTSRELKRIESVSSSPIFAQFSETLNGVSTIRAYGAGDRITQQIQRKVDANHRAFFYLFATNRWLALRTSVLSEIIVFGAGLSIIISGVSAGWAGVAFIFANQFTGNMTRMIQVHSSMEMSMNAVERVEEYSKLPQEPPAIVDTYRPPANWPTQGKIEVQDLTIKYASDLPDALKSISFSVQPCEKLGIVGRTGAGKSTLSIAFFRILPFVKGTIVIDGIDISRLGLRDLRSCLTIIPQDPVLFEGTLRSNLDPLNEHDDETIWKALQHTNLLESLQKPQERRSDTDSIVVEDDDLARGSSSPVTAISMTDSFGVDRTANSSLSLNAHVNENGNNFSQGQKQLMCLARALLRSRRLIFLDEATASVDADTDSKIQDTIRSQFSDATVLTVAHRLRTVIDYDRVLVMDQGEVAEIGTPFELLERKGMFASMCRESGDYDQLVEIATACHKKKQLIDV